MDNPIRNSGEFQKPFIINGDNPVDNKPEESSQEEKPVIREEIKLAIDANLVIAKKTAKKIKYLAIAAVATTIAIGIIVAIPVGITSGPAAFIPLVACTTIATIGLYIGKRVWKNYSFDREKFKDENYKNDFYKFVQDNENKGYLSVIENKKMYLVVKAFEQDNKLVALEKKIKNKGDMSPKLTALYEKKKNAQAKKVTKAHELITNAQTKISQKNGVEI